MTGEPIETDCPDELWIGDAERRSRLIRRRDCHAVLGPPAPNEDVLCTLGEEEATVVAGDLPAREVARATPPEAARRLAPVYGDEAGRGYAVPTGRVFVRRPKGQAISELSDAIASAGYRLAEPLSWAPHAAWVVAESGAIGDALSGLSKLASAPGIAAAEPQLLRPRSSREAGV